MCFVLNAYADKENPVPGEVIEYKYSNNSDSFEFEYKTPAEARAAISIKDGVKKIETGDIEGFIDISTGVLWVFTLQNNPAHPAVMKLRAFESGKGLYVKTKVICEASKFECDKFVSYQALLGNLVAELYKTYKETPNNGLKGDAQKQRAP